MAPRVPERSVEERLADVALCCGAAALAMAFGGAMVLARPALPGWLPGLEAAPWLPALGAGVTTVALALASVGGGGFVVRRLRAASRRQAGRGRARFAIGLGAVALATAVACTLLWAPRAGATYRAWQLDLRGRSETAVVAALRGPDAGLRQAAARELGRRRAAATIPDLIGALADAEAGPEAAEALGRLARAAAPALVAAFAAPSRDARERAHGVLLGYAEASELNRRHVEGLLADALDAKQPVRLRVAAAWAVPTLAESALVTLLPHLEDADVRVRFAATCALVASKDAVDLESFAATGAPANFPADPDPWARFADSAAYVRRAALVALPGLPWPTDTAAAAVRGAMADPETRPAALAALRWFPMEWPGLLPEVVAALADPAARGAAAHLLGEMGRAAASAAPALVAAIGAPRSAADPPAYDEAVDAVEDALDDAAMRVCSWRDSRACAARALGEIVVAVDPARLLPALDDPSNELRVQVARLLAPTTDAPVPHRDWIRYCIRTLAREDYERANAIQLLGDCGPAAAAAVTALRALANNPHALDEHRELANDALARIEFPLSNPGWRFGPPADPPPPDRSPLGPR